MKVGDKCLIKFALDEAHLSFKRAYEVLLANPQQLQDWDNTLIELLNRWSFVLYYYADFDGIYRLVSKHEETALNIDDRAATAMYHAWLGWSHWGIGSYETCETYLLKALEIGQEIQDQEIIAYVYTWYSWTLTCLGRFDEAIALGKKAVQLAIDFDLDQYLHFKSRAAVANAYWFGGDRLKSLEEGKKLKKFGESRGSIPAITFGYIEIGGSYILDGNFSKAIEWLERIVGEQKDFIYYHSSLIMQGMAYFSSGDYERSENALQKGLDYLLKNSRFHFIAIPGEFFLGGVWIARGRMSAGMQKIQDTRNRLFQTGYKFFYAVSEYMLGGIFLKMTLGEGDINFATILKNIGFLIKNLPFAKIKAENHLRKAILLADEIGAKSIKGQALLDLGRLYMRKKRQEEAQECLTKAIEVFELCEVETYKKKAKDALASLMDP